MNTKNNKDKNAFTPRWRNFHPNSTVWLKNPFNKDREFQAADEFDRPVRYVLPAGKISELPGGLVATLGVKQIVDELIQNDSEDSKRMWNPKVRAKHEAKVIERVKEAPLSIRPDAPDTPVNLGVDTDEPEQATEKPQDEPEEEFPDLKDEKADQEVDKVAAASVAGLPDEAVIDEE